MAAKRRIGKAAGNMDESSETLKSSRTLKTFYTIKSTKSLKTFESFETFETFPSWYHATFYSHMILSRTDDENWAICPENQMDWTFYIREEKEDDSKHWLVRGEKEGESPFVQHWFDSLH